MTITFYTFLPVTFRPSIDTDVSCDKLWNLSFPISCHLGLIWTDKELLACARLFACVPSTHRITTRHPTVSTISPLPADKLPVQHWFLHSSSLFLLLQSDSNSIVPPKCVPLYYWALASSSNLPTSPFAAINQRTRLPLSAPTDQPPKQIWVVFWMRICFELFKSSFFVWTRLPTLLFSAATSGHLHLLAQ